MLIISIEIVICVKFKLLGSRLFRELSDLEQFRMCSQYLDIYLIIQNPSTRVKTLCDMKPFLASSE